MSGGSYDYAYIRVADFADALDTRLRESDHYTPEQRKAREQFVAHLRLVEQAMHDIEWVDSGDSGTGDEVEAILRCLRRNGGEG